MEKNFYDVGTTFLRDFDDFDKTLPITKRGKDLNSYSVRRIHGK